MALKAGYKGIKKFGPGLKYDNVNGILNLEGESDLSLDNLKDVNITTPADGDYLTYDPTNEEWYNEQPDSTPTEDSSKLVTSGGVYGALEDITDLIPEDASSSNKLATASDVNDLWSANAVLGAKNGLPLKLSAIKSANTSGTWADNVYTRNSVDFTFTTDDNDNVTEIDINGTSSAQTDVWLLGNGWSYSNSIKLALSQGIEYKISGISYNNDYFINVLGKKSDGTDVINARSNDSNNGVFTIPSISGLGYLVYFRAAASTAFNHLKITPMITLSADTDPTYAPFAMTNGELTEKMTTQTSAFTDIVEGATVNAGLGGNYIEKNGNIVTVQLGLQTVTATAWSTVIAKLPVGFRPSHNVYFRPVGGDGLSVNGAILASDGSIKVGTALNNNSYAIQLSFSVNGAS